VEPAELNNAQQKKKLKLKKTQLNKSTVEAVEPNPAQPKQNRCAETAKLNNMKTELNNALLQRRMTQTLQ
jgi:hypothetical protein